MSLSIRERIEQQIRAMIADEPDWAAERFDTLNPNTASSVGTTVAVVSASDEDALEESQSGGDSVVQYLLRLDVSVQVVQPAGDTLSTSARINAARDVVIRRVMADPFLTETVAGGTGEALAIDTLHDGTIGPLAADGEDGVAYVVVQFEIHYRTFKGNPGGAPGITERP